jgi:hypothetical protein
MIVACIFLKGSLVKVNRLDFGLRTGIPKLVFVFRLHLSLPSAVLSIPGTDLVLVNAHFTLLRGRSIKVLNTETPIVLNILSSCIKSALPVWNYSVTYVLF